jgi:hypothetical protein
MEAASSMDDQKDDLFDDNEGTDSDAGSADAGDGDDAPPAAKKGKPESANSETRINDLMSKWQSEQAKNAQLEARLAALEAGAGNGGESRSAERDAETNEFLELAREQGRSALFASDPRFAQYGFEVTAIEGQSAKEMQASAARLRGVIEKVEGSARTNALREFGLSPEVTTGGRDKAFDPLTATDQEIAEMADRMLGR